MPLRPVEEGEKHSYMYVRTSCVCLVSVSRVEGSDCSFLGGGEREGVVVLILIRYKIELGQQKALFSQSESLKYT